jgi:hypothetical protein
MRAHASFALTSKSANPSVTHIKSIACRSDEWVIIREVSR